MVRSKVDRAAREQIHGSVSRTLAQGVRGRKNESIMIASLIGCVINGDTITGVLQQATDLVIAVIVLVIVKACLSRFGGKVEVAPS